MTDKLRQQFKAIDPKIRVSNYLLQELNRRGLAETLTQSKKRKMIRIARGRGRTVIQEFDYKQMMKPRLDLERSRDWQWSAWETRSSLK